MKYLVKGVYGDLNWSLSVHATNVFDAETTAERTLLHSYFSGEYDLEIDHVSSELGVEPLEKFSALPRPAMFDEEYDS
jgi:hypothetical protein